MHEAISYRAARRNAWREMARRPHWSIYGRSMKLPAWKSTLDAPAKYRPAKVHGKLYSYAGRR